jgi:hypothetical protein
MTDGVIAPLRCPSCGHIEEADARFCGACGAAFPPSADRPTTNGGAELVACAECGHREDPSARFCGECGTVLEGATTASSDGREPGEVDAPPPGVTPATPLPPEPTQIGSDQSAPEESGAKPPPPVRDDTPWRKSRRGWALLAGIVALVIAGGATAAVLATRGDGKSKSTTLRGTTFWSLANGALGRLATANQQAQADLAQTLLPDSATQLNQDGAAIVFSADRTAAQLRRLAHPSTEQVSQSHVLLTVLAANRAYGTIIQEYAQQSVDIAAVQSSAAAAADAVRAADSELPPTARLPSPTVFNVSAPAPTESTPTQTMATTVQSQTAESIYVSEVDAGLAAAHQTLGRVAAFVPNVVNEKIESAAAIVEAERFTALRKRTLASVLGLQAPARFALAHAVLVQSLRLSIADDQALILWARARQRGADPQTFLDRANRMGAEATAAKKRFLAIYGPLRRAATGKPASSLPDGY